MTPELDSLLANLEPSTDENRHLRLAFGLACVGRLKHLLEEPEVILSANRFMDLAEEGWPVKETADLAAELDLLANRHRGSRSLDGVGHAAVSATYACARAVAGRARQAAEYAAYAMVYAQGGYGATSDQESFAPELAWQAHQLRTLLQEQLPAPYAA